MRRRLYSAWLAFRSFCHKLDDDDEWEAWMRQHHSTEEKGVR